MTSLSPTSKYDVTDRPMTSCDRSESKGDLLYDDEVVGHVLVTSVAM